jgi:UDP-glucose 4-epimerase
MADTILVTGGAGYIGSHTCIELLAAGHRVVVLDNLCNASQEALTRVQAISGRTLEFERIDLLDASSVQQAFARVRPDAVIHFAGLKAVGESVSQPLRYFHNNVTGALHVLQAMQAQGCRRLVFSSSATVYGDPERVPITEDCLLRSTNPYGRSKLMIEDICRDLAAAEPAWSISLLRYFNPIGAHSSGLIGEDPTGIPNNLMPYLMQVAIGKRSELSIYGNDYATVDGTGVRDYIHVVDLALGHLAALSARARSTGCIAVNLGTGQGCSVLQLVAAASAAVGRQLPYRFVARRPGDIAAVYADVGQAERTLSWRATRSLQQMCEDSWRWQRTNPQGYGRTPE